MISPALANLAIGVSLSVTLVTYILLSRYDGSYINIFVPSLLVAIPAFYLLPLIYIFLFGVTVSTYAFVYVYATLALENIAFVYGYARANKSVLRLPFRFSHRNFGLLAWACVGLAVLTYLPVLVEFREYLLNPREIYTHTRTGFGLQFYISSILAYLAVILILFTTRSWLIKTVVITIAAGVLLLHGSKGQVLNLVLLLALFHVYVRGRKVSLIAALTACSCIALVVVLLFASTMYLGEGPSEVLETISQYSDYTRNAFLVIDEHFPLQYGRLTLELNTIALIPRAFMSSKPKNFGAFVLDEEFYPESFDSDTGSPDFGIGVQYADFGFLAIAYLALFSMFRGWLARIFIGRLRLTKHPADFFVLAFLAEISVMPLGGAGWLLPEALFVAIGLRFLSTIGSNRTYVEGRGQKDVPGAARALGALNHAEGIR